jgi:hypothetical protein
LQHTAHRHKHACQFLFVPCDSSRLAVEYQDMFTVPL